MYNTHKPYANSEEKGHTHVESFKQAKRLVNLVLRKKIPYDLSPYLLESLYRLGEDDYAKKALEVLKNKKKKQRYYNKSGKNKRVKQKNYLKRYKNEKI